MDEFNNDDLKKFEVKYKAEQAAGKVTQNTQFNYAWYLIRSPYTNDIKKGVVLLQELCTHGTDQRDFLYFLAEGNYKLAEYPTALKYINRVLDIEPSNKQAEDLKQKIEQKMKRDGVMGAAIAGAGMVVVGGTMLALAGAAALVGMVVKRR